MSEETQVQKDAFTVTKDSKDFVFVWSTVQKGSNKGNRFPSLDTEVHGIDDLIAFYGADQAKLVLGARARQNCKAWYDAVIEKHDAFTDAARNEYVTLVQEGKLARITMAELNDQISAKMVEMQEAANQVSTNEDPSQKAEWSMKLAELVQEVGRLEDQKSSLKRSRKKKATDDEEEDEDND